MLSSESIAAIRRLLSLQPRKEIKQLLLESGAKTERILSIPVISNMKSKDYRTIEDILSMGFDTLYVDYGKTEADRILLKLLSILHGRGIDISNINDKLRPDGIDPEEILYSRASETATDLPEERNVQGIEGRERVKGPYEYDVFVCHASEDKDSFVRPLVQKLREEGLNVWYDEFTIRVGDSLRRKIDQGLSKSQYGIVVLSPNFFEKEWPQKELDGLTAREIKGVKVILPVWHNVGREEVMRYSPVLADRVGVSTSGGLKYVVSELLKVLRPENDAETEQDEQILSEKTENKIDKLKNRFKDHPIGFIMTVVFLIVISLGLFTDSLDKAIEFGKKYLFSPEKKILTTPLRGVVRNINDEPVSGAVVDVLELPGKSITTTSDGGFYFPEVPGKAGDKVRVYISKPGYQKHNEYVTLPGPIIIKLEKYEK